MHTSAALSLRALASKIHPPLPLNPRESAQLLTILTTAFRRQLDKEHPHSTFNHVVDSASPLPKLNSPSPAPDDRTSDTAQTYAARHFNSVLQNPLFAPGPHTWGKPSTRSSQKLPGVKRSSVGDAHQLFQDPLVWFEGHVSRGTASIGHAQLCLQTLRASMSGKTGASLRQAMKESGAGSKVVNWIWSSGLEGKKEFLSSGALMYPLAQFLVEEGRWGVLLRWLRTPAIAATNMDDVSLEPILQWRSNLIQAVIEGQLMHESGQCTAAIQFFLRAISEKEPLPQQPIEFIQWVNHSIFGIAGRWIAHELCKPAAERKLLTTPQLFDRFLSTITIWSKREEYYKAKLFLHHPQQPDATRALKHVYEYIKQPFLRRQLEQNSPGRRRGYVIFCFDVTRFLLRHGNHKDASMVLQFLKDQFPEELGLQKDLLSDQSASYYFSTRTKSFFASPTRGAEYNSDAKDAWDEEQRKKAEEANLLSLESLALG